MKEKSNATLRRAASLRCRTDAAIDRLGARIAMGYESNAECRRQALAFARTAARLGNRRTAFIAHDLLWAAAGGLPSEEEFAAFEACEML